VWRLYGGSKDHLQATRRPSQTSKIVKYDECLSGFECDEDLLASGEFGEQQRELTASN
jgi:hypothetical protein